VVVNEVLLLTWGQERPEEDQMTATTGPVVLINL
jgi:hypothetical protein